MHITDLSLNEKIGQRFIMGVNNRNIDDVLKLVKYAFIGGVVLYKKNYQSYEEMITVIKKIKVANAENKLPLFVAIDQEGGRVNRLPNEIHNLESIYDLSKRDYNMVYDYANIIGKILSKSGINMNFAPVLDIDNGKCSKALLKRCFYGDVTKVTDSAIKYFEGNNNMTIPVIKHYPGHGVTRYDTHFMVPFIFNSKKVAEHIQPFNKIIANGVDALMIGHLVIPSMTGLLPATISNKFLSDLRKEYSGLIITDEINMLKRTGIYSSIYVTKALKAPSDIVLVKIKTYDEGKKILDKYKKLYQEQELNNTVNRIVSVKDKYNINDKINYSGSDIAKINKEIDRINELVLRDEECQ
jgi:beta-N-acetylhexosaminidase